MTLIRRSIFMLMPRCFSNSTAHYAVPGALGGSIGSKLKGKQAGPVVKKVALPVETDVHKLVKYVCGSDYRKENPIDIEIKDDSEYPDWLWDLHIGSPMPLYEMEPTSKNYWRRMKYQVYLQRQRVKATQKF